ncbi:MucR family transcriptional regulator [Geobacter argillaceus]|uniref:MucR family transcriptional regulator n=1 Tax=Geobacter argillaceus TaxID=345631 RepID=A0A562VPG6_9BACT|nr:MucR family transcriptional regulator [Geobacter argillaceus]TWJ19825.1 MucR family transcriptional regulator [Geobacter argillaceus]
MATLLELVGEIVSAHASTTPLTGEELLKEIQQVYAQLKTLESGEAIGVAAAEETAKPTLSVKQAFKKDEVICLICGKGKMKTLTRHLNSEHNMKPGEYRKQFGISRTQSLTAKSFSDARRKTAEERGLAANLAKARAVRAENLATKSVKPKPKTTKKTK